MDIIDLLLTGSLKVKKPTAIFTAAANASAKLYITGTDKQKISVDVNGVRKYNWTLPKSASSFSVKSGDELVIKSDITFTVETYDNLTPVSADGCIITGFDK